MMSKKIKIREFSIVWWFLVITLGLAFWALVVALHGFLML